MRGKAVTKDGKLGTYGITPACAGKSVIIIIVCPLHIGSPPRVRGKVNSIMFPIPYPRITPACAGKRCSPYIPYKTDMGSPPRVRGKAVLLCLVAPYIGSPPRVRGKVCEISVGVGGVRITPACVGKRLKGIIGEEQA